MNEREQFQGQVKSLLKPVLVADGFRASGTTYRRQLGEVIHVLTLQGSRSGGKCCVCLGIHLAFFPGDYDPKCITEPQCEFRTRLTPPGRADYWWSYGANEDQTRASVESIVRLYREVGAPYFESFSRFPEDFTRVTPSMLSSEVDLPFPHGLTDVGRALALSRIAIHIGRIADAKEFARFGLTHAGPAVALKSEFKKILTMDEPR